MINASLDDIGAGTVLLQADYIRAGPSAPPVSCDQNGWYHLEKSSKLEQLYRILANQHHSSYN